VLLGLEKKTEMMPLPLMITREKKDKINSMPPTIENVCVQVKILYGPAPTTKFLSFKVGLLGT
jgi:hypothetical protein